MESNPLELLLVGTTPTSHEYNYLIVHVKLVRFLFDDFVYMNCQHLHDSTHLIMVDHWAFLVTNIDHFLKCSKKLHPAIRFSTPQGRLCSRRKVE